MRTTIRLDEELLKEVKKLAADSGRTLTAVIEDALRETLRQRQTKAKRPRIILRTFKGDGLQPGVDLSDSAALLEFLEGPYAPS